MEKKAKAEAKRQRRAEKKKRAGENEVDEPGVGSLDETN